MLLLSAETEITDIKNITIKKINMRVLNKLMKAPGTSDDRVSAFFSAAPGTKCFYLFS
jgi:hypothetical protein